MGMTILEAIRVLLKRVTGEKALLFKPLVPNAETIAAMREARRGGLRGFSSVNDLMNELSVEG
jgi:DNA-damage-inducible protein J